VFNARASHTRLVRRAHCASLSRRASELQFSLASPFDHGLEERLSVYDRIAPDLTKRERDSLEGAGMTPRQIDDIIAMLRVRMPDGFSPQDVLDVMRLGHAYRRGE